MSKNYSPEYIAERIIMIRVHFGLNQQEMASEMTHLGFDITPMTLSNYERGLNSRSIKLDLLFYYITKGINLKWLLIPDNKNEPMLDFSKSFSTEKEFITDLLKTALKTINEQKS